MNRARIDAQAWNDVAAIAEYLGKVGADPRAARKLIDEFVRKCESYARQPTMGDLQEDLGEGFGVELRSFLFRRVYVAIYRPMSDGIDVLRVFDARSGYGRHFGE